MESPGPSRRPGSKPSKGNERGRRWIATSVSLCLLGQTACSLLSPSTQNIVIQPMPGDAELYVDGAPVGRGTQSVRMSKKQSHTVIAKCGRSSGVASVDRSISITGILDVVGGILFYVPFIGVLAPGFWTLDPPTVAIAVPDGSACVTDAQATSSPAKRPGS
jgi:hypothetical protein